MARNNVDIDNPTSINRQIQTGKLAEWCMHARLDQCLDYRIRGKYVLCIIPINIST